PDGTIIGARGQHALLAPDNPLKRWFAQTYTDRFSMAPIYPAYDMAQSMLGLKAAWEKAQAKKGGARPSTDEIIAAFEGIDIPTRGRGGGTGEGKGHPGHRGPRLWHVPVQQGGGQARARRHRAL